MKLETISRVSLIGLRFVDAALETLVTDGLQVEALPAADVRHPRAWQRRRRGVQTPSGVIAFHDLPGMREAEHGAGDDAYWSALAGKDFVAFAFEVLDLRGRFHPSRFERTLPVRFRPDPDQPPRPAAVPLYSTPARVTPPGQLAVFLELRAGGAPAAWAGLRLQGAGVEATGVADDEGRVLVLLPYPDPNRAVITSPPTARWQWGLQLGAAPFPAPSPPDPRPELLDLDRLPQAFTALPLGDVRLVDGLTYLERGGAPLTTLDL